MHLSYIGKRKGRFDKSNIFRIGEASGTTCALWKWSNIEIRGDGQRDREQNRLDR